MKRIKLNINQL